MNMKKTCTDRKNEDTGEGMNYDECVKFCNQDPECKFIFHIPENQHGLISCIKCNSCNGTAETRFVGSTYSREGDCPGNPLIKFVNTER